MTPKSMMARAGALAALVLVAACQDMPTTLAAPDDALAARGNAPQDVRAWFNSAAPEVLALRGTVFADHDESTNQLVFGVEDDGVTRGVQNALWRRGIPATAYRIEITEPIHFMSDNLRSEHRPTVGGLQIHWDGFVCTLGFNVSHSGGRSFITNSHCTTVQGENSGTFYNQPSRTASPTPIADEVDDPAYFTGGACPANRVCRHSDAARALYRAGAESTRGAIAKPTGLNNHSLAVDGSFTITSQNNNTTSFSGTLNKVGRTTGWTSGNVTNTCASVNVGGTNITLLCQTLVHRRGRSIVQGGDSGSPVFRVLSGDDVELVGILWGGSSSGDLFVFSPLKNIQDELGAVTATSDGSGGGGDPEPPPPDDDEPSCPPGHQRQGRC